MKTPMLIGIVAAVHCVAIGSAILIQGCGTPDQPKPTPPSAASTAGKGPKESSVRSPTSPKSAEPKKQAAETTTYVVAQGDTVSLIAKRFNLTVAEITQLNGMTDANKIRVGQKMLLPGKVDLNAPRPAARAKPAATSPAEGKVHVVKQGETLPAIAAEYKVSIAELRKANDLAADKVQAGQKLVIPVSVVEKTEKPGTPPSGDATPAAAASMDKPPAANGAAGAQAATVKAQGRVETYTVQPGDNLLKIAMTRTISVSTLRRLNNLPENAEVKLGQVIKIPASE